MNELSFWLIGLLASLNLIQFFFWSFQVHRLVNKLMSKDFAEYNAIVKGPPERTPQVVDFDSVVEEQDILKELNSLLSTP